MGKTKQFMIHNWPWLLAGLVLLVLTLATHYYGSTDIGDYSDTAKYFSGDYSAKIRNSHSFVLGLVHSPFVALTQNFIFFKISSLFCLLAIMYSVYRISGRDKRSFLLVLFSPALWYMAPWISPVQISTLIFLWSYYFIREYNSNNSLKYLFLSGLLLGLSIIFWNAALYFGVALGLAFLFDKKFYHFLIFGFGLLVGMLPLFILDFVLFNFPFYTLVKTNLGQFLVTFTGAGVDGVAVSFLKPLDILFVILSFPIYFWMVYKKEFMKENKHSVIFVSLSLLIILVNLQMRYALIISPIIILLISKYIDFAKFKKYLLFSIIIIVFFMVPYVIQINHSMTTQVSGIDVKEFILNLKSDFPLKNAYSEELSSNLNDLIKEYPEEIFVVGNRPDDYQVLADIYWGNQVKEFVSIQDYNLWINNETSVFKKTLQVNSNIKDRRIIWIAGGISANSENFENYSDIDYVISLNGPLESERGNFTFVKQYGYLHLYKNVL